MLVTPVYEVKDFDKFSIIIKKFKTIFESVLSNQHRIEFDLKFKQCFALKGKYLIPAVVGTNTQTDPLAFLLYLLIKEGIIQLCWFYTDKGEIITKEKHPKEFSIYVKFLQMFQGVKYDGSCDLISADYGFRFKSVDARAVIVAFEPGIIASTGDSKILTIKVHYSLVPDCDFNECVEYNLYPRSLGISSAGIFAMVEKDSIKFTYPNASEETMKFAPISNTQFSLRDVILLSTVKKFIPYAIYNTLVGFNEKGAKEYIKSISNKKTLSNIIKVLLLDTPNYGAFDGAKLTFSYNPNVELNIDLREIEGVVASKTPIGLAKYLKHNSLLYEDVRSLSVPSDYKVLFKPTSGNIEYGLYAKYKGLLIPLIMIDSGHYFVSVPLLSGLTLYGFFKEAVPFKLVERDLIEAVIDYGGRVSVVLRPLLNKWKMVECVVRLDKSFMPLLSMLKISSMVDAPEMSFLNIRVSDKVVSILKQILNEHVKNKK